MNNNLQEITFFGRGGQGAVIASEILADAYFREGFEVQSFPSFGVERRGAPVTAFLRISNEFIYIRSMIARADIGLVFATGILSSPQFLASVKDSSLLIVNSPSDVELTGDLRVCRIDANQIAAQCELGSTTQPLVNTALLGAYAGTTKNLSLENLLAAVEEGVPQKTEANLRAVKLAYEAVRANE